MDFKAVIGLLAGAVAIAGLVVGVFVALLSHSQTSTTAPHPAPTVLRHAPKLSTQIHIATGCFRHC